MKGVKTFWIPVAAVFAVVLASCERLEPVEPLRDRKVLVMYSCGYNNLSGNLAEDISLLCKDAPPATFSKFYKLLVFSHKTASFGNYTTPTHPVLIDVYKDMHGSVVMDTVKVYPETMVGASSEAVGTVLSDIVGMYPSAEYGMVMSSHATGWLPEHYYNGGSSGGALFSVNNAVMMYAPPLVKSMCSHYGVKNGQVFSDREIGIVDFASVIPVHLKYLVLDMCLMGGVECAYEFRNVTDFLAVSPTEILSDGIEYGNLLKRLLYSDVPDVRGVCEDYFNYYSDKNSSATISLVDCRNMEPFAAVCAHLFEKYRSGIENVNQNTVQRYWRDGKHWFYDLRDILVNAGVSAADLAAFDDTMASCVLYNEATPKFLEIPIRTHCGLSMYLPKMDSNAELRAFYGGLAWNKATSLVK